jgi:hypothetical protein
MVRLNTQGFKEQVQLEVLKKLPQIPGTGARLKKKNLTDLGPSENCLSLIEATEHEDDPEVRGSRAHHEQIRETANSSINYHSANQNNHGDEDTTTVFDLVHRGRQRQQHIRELQRMSKEGMSVHSPKILSPVSVQPRRASGLVGDGQAPIQPNSSQNYLLGRKHLSSNYRSVSGGHKHKNLVRSKDRKRAIREFNKEVQSAVLPEINSATLSYKAKSFRI